MFPGGDVLVLQAAVALHDLADIIHGGKQLAQASGVEHQGQETVVPVFLHGPDPGAVTLQLLFFQCSGVVHFPGFFLDHLVVQSNLLLVQFHLLKGKGIALIQSQLPLQHIRVLGLQLVHNGLLGGLLPGDLIPLFFQRVDLALGHGVSLRGQGTQDQAQHGHHAQNQRQ